MRMYRIVHRGPRGNQSGKKPGWWAVESVAFDSVEGKVDLRNMEHVEMVLASMAQAEWGPTGIGMGFGEEVI
jgi:hypothetical protein